MIERCSPDSFTYITVEDLRRNDFEDRHLGRFATDKIIVKIIWSREACDLLHQYTPEEGEDLDVIYLDRYGLLDKAII